MLIGSNAQRLAAVPDAEESNYPPRRVTTKTEPVVCSICFGSGMEVVPGKGARRCLCRAEDAHKKLLDAARIPRRYEECSLANYRPAPNNGSSSVAPAPLNRPRNPGRNWLAKQRRLINCSSDSTGPA